MLPVVLRELCTIAGIENTPLDVLRASRVDPEMDLGHGASGASREDTLADSSVETIDGFIAINVLMYKMFHTLLVKKMLRELKTTSATHGKDQRDSRKKAGE